MTDELDRVLREGLLQPPPDFEEHLMRRLRMTPEAPSHSRFRVLLRWLALIGAGLIGATQLAGFVFGIWAASAAG